MNPIVEAEINNAKLKEKSDLKLLDWIKNGHGDDKSNIYLFFL